MVLLKGYKIRMSFKRSIRCLLTFIMMMCLAIGCYAADYDRIDRIAKQSKEYLSLGGLVRELTRELKEDQDKARVIYAWIAYHIDYDWYKYEKILEDRFLKQGKDIFKTRLGVCGDIAELYQRMAHLAGLKCEVVIGYAGRKLSKKTLEDSRHAWNAVEIDNKWYLVDATWGSQGGDSFGKNIRSDAHYRREVKKRKPKKINRNMLEKTIDERYFMADPDFLIQTHFPHDKKWQLIRFPKSLRSFLRQQ